MVHHFIDLDYRRHTIQGLTCEGETEQLSILISFHSARSKTPGPSWALTGSYNLRAYTKLLYCIV